MGQYSEDGEQEMAFQLFYWGYALGVILLSVLVAFTFGSLENEGRPFMEDLKQADGSMLGSAFLVGFSHKQMN